MYFKIKNIIIVVFVILTLSCDNALFNSGKTIKKSFYLGDFSEVYINDVFNVFLIQDTVTKLELEGGENLLPNIEYYIKDDQFHISNGNSANWSREYERINVYLSIKNISFLKIDESSNVKSEDTLHLPNLRVWSINDYTDIDLIVNCNNFYIVNEGTSGGYFKIQGKSNTTGMWARGSCHIDTKDLISKTVSVKNESIGNCSVYATENLKVEILRSGDVYYKGNPSIEFVNEKAKSQLFKID